MLLRQSQQHAPIAPRDVRAEDFRLGPPDRPKVGVANWNAFEMPGDGGEIVRLAPVDAGFLDQLLEHRLFLDLELAQQPPELDEIVLERSGQAGSRFVERVFQAYGH